MIEALGAIVTEHGPMTQSAKVASASEITLPDTLLLIVPKMSWS